MLGLWSKTPRFLKYFELKFGFLTETWDSVMVLHFDDFQLNYSLVF